MMYRGSLRKCGLYVVGATMMATAAASPAADWPQWRGPARDGKSADTGLLKEWPEGGPKLAWKATALGSGYASISVVGNRLYTMGDIDGASTLLALDGNKDGKIIWSLKVGKAGAPGWGGFGGPRCTPTVDGGQVFAVDQWGEFICAGTDGKEQWRKSYEKDFGAKRPEWGFSESPLVDGDKVIATPGGQGGAMVALDRKTGEVLWRSKDFRDGAQYSSIVIAEFGGVRQYVQLFMNNLVGVSAKDGAVLWNASREGKTAVIPTPIIEGEIVYVTSGYGVGCNAFKITAQDGKFRAEEVYSNKEMANHHGGVIQLGNNVYGYSDGKGLVCQELKSGKTVWAEKGKVQKSSVSLAEGMLYVREEDTGTVILVEATGEGFREHGRFAQPNRAKEKAWPHPTIAGGKLYLRDQGTLLCYDLKGK